MTKKQKQEQLMQELTAHRNLQQAVALHHEFGNIDAKGVPTKIATLMNILLKDINKEIKKIRKKNLL